MSGAVTAECASSSSLSLSSSLSSSCQTNEEIAFNFESKHTPLHLYYNSTNQPICFAFTLFHWIVLHCNCLHLVIFSVWFQIFESFIAFALRLWVVGCWSAGSDMLRCNNFYFFFTSLFLLGHGCSFRDEFIPQYSLGLFRQPPQEMNYYGNLVNYCAKCSFSRNNCDNDSESIEMLIYKSIYSIPIYTYIYIPKHGYI